MGAEPIEKVGPDNPFFSKNPRLCLRRGFDNLGQKYSAMDRKGRRLGKGSR